MTATNKGARTLCAGKWSPQGKSCAVGAVLARQADGRLLVQDENGTALSFNDFRDVTISARIASIPRTVVFTDGSVFETLDNNAIDAIDTNVAGRGAGVINRMERFSPWLIVFVLATVLSVIGLYRYGLPALVEVAVRVTPPVVPELMSAGTMRSLDATVFNPSSLSDDDIAPLREGFERLAAHSEHPVSHYTLLFRDAPAIGPNAFALPDGTMVITDQLVEMAPNQEMVIAVIGHEIGHVEMQHSLRHLYRNAGIVALAMFITGDIGPIMEDVLIQGTILLQLSHSRQAELEADRRSVELMHAAGFDPAAMGGFFALLSREFGDVSERTDYFSTHPATPRRRRAIEQLVEDIGGSNAPDRY